MTLRTKASFLISLIVIIVMGFSGAYNIYFLRQSLKESIFAGVEGVSDSTSQAISKFLADSLSEAQAVALALPVEALEERNAPVIRDRLKYLLEIFPKFENGMFILGKDGRLWVDYPQNPMVKGTDFSYREYFKKTIKEGHGVIGVPYVSGRTGEPVVTFTALLRGTNQQVVGVLGCSVKILSPDALGGIRKVRIGKGGYIFVFDTSRTMILHPDNARVLKQDIPLGANKLLDAALAGFEGVGETVNSRGVSMLSSFKRIPGMDWIIGAQQPREEAFSPITRAMKGLILNIILMVSVAVLSVAIALRTVTQPLTKLRQAVMFLGEEASSESQRVGKELERISGSDEIGELATAFLYISKKLDETLVSLKMANNDWERTFDSVPDLIAIIGNRYNLVKINQAAAVRLGVNPRDAVGAKCYKLFHGTDEPPEICPHQRLLEDGREHIAEIFEKSQDSTFLVTASPMRNQAGELIGSVHVARDITERKRMEDEKAKLEVQLLQAQKMESIGTLAGGIAHDFNNILTAIIGNISLAMLDFQMKEQSRERLTEAEKACLQAQNLSRQLLTFSRGGKPIKEVVSVKRLIIESASFACRGSKVNCEPSLPDDLWTVEVDPGQISQVFQNLVINAIQAMPTGGLIKIRGENLEIAGGKKLPLDVGRYVKISIQDQGLGISADHLSRIFDPYFTTKQKGSGLGLATSYSIIKNHHGHISVESELGKGTTFNVYLPASDREVIQPPQEDMDLHSGKGKILVMDDEPMVREVLGVMLASLGYEVKFAEDGAEAIEMFSQSKTRQDPFAAVILDLTVPGGMGGKEAMARLLKLDPQVKALVSSGYSEDPIMADFQKYGFTGIIAKPYKISELAKVLNETLTVKD